MRSAAMNVVDGCGTCGGDGLGNGGACVAWAPTSDMAQKKSSPRFSLAEPSPSPSFAGRSYEVRYTARAWCVGATAHGPVPPRPSQGAKVASPLVTTLVNNLS